jgi:uncharacterized LabA/DUF88 family protein
VQNASMTYQDKNSLPNFAFIDAQNLHRSSKHWGWKLDYEKLRNYLRQEYKVEVAYLFIGFIPDNQEIYSNLQKAGYVLVFKETVETVEEIKGNCDVELALQAVIDIENYNQAVIISGDGDFTSLIRYLNSKNKLNILLVPNKTAYSAFLKKTAKDKIGYLNLLSNKLAVNLPINTPKERDDESERKIIRHRTNHKEQLIQKRENVEDEKKEIIIQEKAEPKLIHKTNKTNQLKTNRIKNNSRSNKAVNHASISPALIEVINNDDRDSQPGIYF